MDWREGRVYVGLSTVGGELTYRSTIQCLYVESKLGPAQSISSTARTSHTLSLALESNAAALRKLLPRLNKEDRNSLFALCHGR